MNQRVLFERPAALASLHSAWSVDPNPNPSLAIAVTVDAGANLQCDPLPRRLPGSLKTVSPYSGTPSSTGIKRSALLRHYANCSTGSAREGSSVRPPRPTEAMVEAERASCTGPGANAVGGGGDHVVAEGGGRGQDAVIGRLVRARPGDQRAEPLEQGPGGEDDVRSAVGVGVAQAQEDATLLVERQALGGQRGAGDVAAEVLEAAAAIGSHRDAGREPAERLRAPDHGPARLPLVGIRVYTQAVHLFGITPVALFNAQDLCIGY